MTGILYLVATPIGNFDDITLRAINILNSVDFIICEEMKEGRRLLAHYKIDKILFSLNEHNEKEESEKLFTKIKDGENAALISDCGTPIFSDPGLLLVNLCINNNISVKPIPGANSLMSALSASGINIEKFYYYGWLSPKKEIRKKELLQIKNLKEVIIILDTPYRLKTLITDVVKFLGKNAKIVLAFNLTMEDEKFFRGYAEEVLNIVEKNNLKGEFVLIIDNREK